MRVREGEGEAESERDEAAGEGGRGGFLHGRRRLTTSSCTWARGPPTSHSTPRG